MNRLLVFSFFIFLFFIADAQRKQFKVYYDAEKKHIKELYHTTNEDTTALDGLYKTYYQDGKVKTVGFYTKSQATDYWEYFYQNGNLKMEGIINNFFNQGHWIFYFENGNKSMEGNMDKGKKNGLWKFYTEEGKLKSEGVILNNKNEGVWKYFHEDGNIKAQAKYNRGEGIYTEYYSEGKIKMQGKIKNGKSDSIWTYYYPNGRIKSLGIEQNGAKEKFWKFYHENGNIASEGEYQHGKTQGHWKYYYENGNIKAEGSENETVKEGTWLLYYLDGKPKAEINYVNGEGLYAEFYPNGRIKAKGKIINDKYEGLWYFYMENEFFREGECTYSNGEGWYTGYYPDGKKKTEGLLKDGNKVGVWRLYKKDGTFAGYYKTSENDEELPFANKHPQLLEQKETSNKSKKKSFFQKIHLYRPNPNVYKTFIVSTDPIQFLSGGIPIFVEYYVQENWGLELYFTYFKSPFLKNHAELPNRQIFQEGQGYGVRFKKYFRNEEFIGRPYIAGEYRYKKVKFGSNYTDTSSKIIEQSVVNVLEDSHELILFVGDRFMKSFNKGGPTLDIYLGLGAGYKINSRNYTQTADKDAIFNDIFKNNWYLPFRFGISIGWAF